MGSNEKQTLDYGIITPGFTVNESKNKFNYSVSLGATHLNYDTSVHSFTALGGYLRTSSIISNGEKVFSSYRQARLTEEGYAEGKLNATVPNVNFFGQYTLKKLEGRDTEPQINVNFGVNTRFTPNNNITLTNNDKYLAQPYTYQEIRSASVTPEGKFILAPGIDEKATVLNNSWIYNKFDERSTQTPKVNFNTYATVNYSSYFSANSFSSYSVGVGATTNNDLHLHPLVTADLKLKTEHAGALVIGLSSTFKNNTSFDNDKYHEMLPGYSSRYISKLSVTEWRVDEKEIHPLYKLPNSERNYKYDGIYRNINSAVTENEYNNDLQSVLSKKVVADLGVHLNYESPKISLGKKLDMTLKVGVSFYNNNSNTDISTNRDTSELVSGFLRPTRVEDGSQVNRHNSKSGGNALTEHVSVVLTPKDITKCFTR